MRYLKSFNESFEFDKNVLIIHGYDTESEFDADGCFYPWLKGELEYNGFKVDLPNLPDQKSPNMSKYMEYLLENTQKEDIVIGHSLGAPTALKFVESIDYKIKSLYLISGFIDCNFYEGDEDTKGLSDFCNWTFNFDKIRNNVDRIYILRPNNDTSITPEQTKDMSSLIGVPITYFQEKEDHACGKEEPEILKFILNNEH